MWLQESTNSFLKLSDVERAITTSFETYGKQVYIGYDYSMFSDNTAIVAYVNLHRLRLLNV